MSFTNAETTIEVDPRRKLFDFLGATKKFALLDDGGVFRRKLFQDVTCLFL